MNPPHPNLSQIVDYLHGELSAPDDAALHAHLAGCSSCEELRAQEAALTQRVQASVRAAERELPATVVAAVRREIERRSAPRHRLSLLRPVWAIPAAAVVAAALYVGVQSRHAPSAPTIDASYYVENHAAMAATAPFSDGAPLATLTSDEQAR